MASRPQDPQDDRETDEVLASYRKSIDNIDAALIHMLAERFRITQAVGEYKARMAMPPADPAREAAQIARLRTLAEESALDPEFSDLFQGMLVSKALLEEDQPTVTRAAAASYIASFVSRAVFVDRESTRQVVACLCNFLNNRLDILDAVTQTGASLPSMAQHSVFYAVTQAVFLIFCFRWRDLVQDQEELDELAALLCEPSLDIGALEHGYA